MQLGYTIPLQRWLGEKAPAYGGACDLRFCWELHILKPNGRPSLLAVHASSRFAFLLYGLSQTHWGDVPGLFLEELKRCMAEEGFVTEQIMRYTALAGEPEPTKTHGRRPVAFLNRAVDDLYGLPVGLEPDTREQPQIMASLNDIVCRAAGHVDCGTPRAFFRRDIKELLE